MGNSLQKRKESGENPQQEIEQEAVNAIFTCQVCMEPKSPNKKFKIKNRCCAQPFCLDCIAKYIQVMIEDKAAIVKCPGLNCKQRLDPLSCRPIIPARIFSKWCDLLCDDYVLGFERSYCPDRNCMALVVNECGRSVKKSECPYCKKLFCFQCKLPWHAGYRCEETEQMRERNDILFGQLVEKCCWARCPGCGHCVERNGGCLLMTCSRCRTQFCYRCGRKVANALGCRCSQSLRHSWPIVIIAALIFLLFSLAAKFDLL